MKFVEPTEDELFEHENKFYLTCNTNRIEKMIAQYELFKRTVNVKGDIVECGVYKGTSLMRFAMYRDILEFDKKIYGFDTFYKFPETTQNEDISLRNKFIIEGGQPMKIRDLKKYIEFKGLKKVELIKGDVIETIPKFVKKYKNLSISFINMDLDIYEPTKVALQHLWDKVSYGGIMILDNYYTFVGERNAVKEIIGNYPIHSHRNLMYIQKAHR